MVEFRGEEEEEGKEKATYRVFGSFSWIERFFSFCISFYRDFEDGFLDGFKHRIREDLGR